MNTRPYRMTVRAKDAELTAERIVDAMLARLASTPYEHIRIEDIAADAGVTGQTVIRRFGSKAALMNATVERELGRIVAAREAAAHASAVDTIRDLVLHYERYGALILKTYSEAPLVPGLPRDHRAGTRVPRGLVPTSLHPRPATHRTRPREENRPGRRDLRCHDLAHTPVRRRARRRPNRDRDRRTAPPPACAGLSLRSARESKRR